MRPSLLIDPFITGNSMADVRASDLNPDYILVSHAHGDHLGDTVPIAKRSGATVISNYEIASYMEEQGVQGTWDAYRGRAPIPLW